MSEPKICGPDPARTRLRATLAKLEHEISRLPRTATDDDSASPLCGLLSSFADLVDQLALGAEPEVRTCPFCKHIGMRAATLCGHCWRKLAPPAEGAGADVGLGTDAGTGTGTGTGIGIGIGTATGIGTGTQP